MQTPPNLGEQVPDAHASPTDTFNLALSNASLLFKLKLNSIKSTVKPEILDTNLVHNKMVLHQICKKKIFLQGGNVNYDHFCDVWPGFVLSYDYISALCDVLSLYYSA